MLLITAGGIYWYLFIGIIGMAFFVYGKKKPDTVALITGLILIIYPYFISSLNWKIATGITIIILFFFFKRILRL